MSTLKKEIGALGIAANMVNIVIGGGIYVLPSEVFNIAGQDSIYGYLICGVIVFGIVLSFALLGSDINKSGGASYFIHKSFGDYAGFLSNVMLWFGIGALVNAALINVLSNTIGIESMLIKALFFIAILTCLVFLNIRGVKYGNNFVVINTIIKIMPLILIILFGLPHVNFDNLSNAAPMNINAVGQASILLFFAFGGAEAALNFGEEIKDPGKNVFYGLFIGLATIVIIYVLLQIVCQGIVGPELANYKNAPIAEVGNKIFGPVAFGLIKVATFFSVFVALSGGILSYPRALYAGAEYNWYPQRIRDLHSSYSTPFIAIIVYAIVVFILAISGQWKQLIILANGATLLIYIAVILAMLKQPLDHLSKGLAIIAKGIALFSLMSMIYLLSQMKQDEVMAVVIAVVAFSAAYFGYKSWRNNEA
jgi:basic amino acid/polyamine antiporter, APA family